MTLCHYFSIYISITMCCVMFTSQKYMVRVVEGGGAVIVGGRLFFQHVQKGAFIFRGGRLL